jgi:hypothetical protein
MVHKISTSQRMKLNRPIEVWENPDKTWRWEVYKKYQKDDNKPYARWFCKVTSPMTEGDWGDVYVNEIKSFARKVSEDKDGS